jgi:hypothetical protein
MSTEEVAAKLNEVPNKSVTGLVLGMAIKYGLPSVCCIYLFSVIDQKDKIIADMLQKTTAALVESNLAKRDSNDAIKQLAQAVNELSRRDVR